MNMDCVFSTVEYLLEIIEFIIKVDEQGSMQFATIKFNFLN